MSIDDGVTWTSFPAGTEEGKWPTCVGGDGSSTAKWRNSARPGLVYDTKNQVVNFAVTRVRANSEVAISVLGYPLATVVHPATDAGPPTIVPNGPPTVSFTTPRYDQPANIREDQWMPALTADTRGNLHMSWYDTARSVAETDADLGWPSGLWGFSWGQNSAPPAVATRLISAPNGYLFNNPNYIPFYSGRPSLGDYHGSANIIGKATFVESATDGYANGTYLSPSAAAFGMFTTVDF
ncbi:hypothetical protein BH09MYX1_BH09MYX1_52470 [soil metagenome]